ncbi:MAG: HXXEE domain-containing protein [Bacteroidales bacterium]|nr:HXXEE domain-containing protein [Bacteroidales bacterium]
MKKIVNNWYNISVYLAGISALVALLCVQDIVSRLLWLSISFLFLHFFEEFGWPGGFPYMGVKVMLGKDERDKSKWDVNNLSSMFGNWGFLLLIYALPLILPGVKLLTLGAMMFSMAELVMHLILFNVRTRSLYNPGLVTALTGLTPISFYYFFTVFDASLFAWWEWVVAVAWFVLVFWFCFRSPLYWNLGRKPGYEMNDQTAFGI